MHSSARVFANRLTAAAFCVAVAAASSAAQTSIRSLEVLGSKDAVEVEVEASDRVIPQTRVLTGPDRLVIDFPNSVPGNQLRSQSVDRGQVKDVRVGLFQSRPPVTRVVVDLKTAQSFQIFPYGRTVMIKMSHVGAVSAQEQEQQENQYAAQPQTRPGLVTANYVTHAEPVVVSPPVQPALVVTYHDGLLGIHANKATLSEILYAVQQRTGADVSIAAGAEQEQVVAEIAPAPAPEVLAHLLNGSRFNFLILSSPNNPAQLDRVILTARLEGTFLAPPPAPVQPVAQNNDASDDDSAASTRQPNTPPPGQPAAGQDPEVKPPAADNTPDQ